MTIEMRFGDGLTKGYASPNFDSAGSGPGRRQQPGESQKDQAADGDAHDQPFHSVKQTMPLG